MMMMMMLVYECSRCPSNQSCQVVAEGVHAAAGVGSRSAALSCTMYPSWLCMSHCSCGLRASWYVAFQWQMLPAALWQVKLEILFVCRTSGGHSRVVCLLALVTPHAMLQWAWWTCCCLGWRSKHCLLVYRPGISWTSCASHVC